MRCSPLRSAVLAALLITSLLPVTAEAGLDPSFGPGSPPGLVQVQLRDRFADDPSAAQVTVHPDGSMFVAVLEGVWKYTADGEIDATFGTVVPGFLPLAGFFPVDATIDASGQVVLLGQRRGPGTTGDPVVIRMSATGTIDAGFDGEIPTPYSILPAALVEVDPDVVVASISTFTGTLCLDRLRAVDGLLDPSFDSDGHSCVDGLGPIIDARGRHNTDGSYTAYGTEATRLRPVTFTSAGTAQVMPVLLDDPTGTIVDVALPDDATVIVSSQTGGHTLIRRLSNGAIDNSLGGAGQPGIAELADFQLRRLHVLPDGRVLALGATPPDTTQQPQARLLTADGHPDGSLNPDGEMPDRINLPRGATGLDGITESTFLDAAPSAAGTLVLLAGERHTFRDLAQAAGVLARTTTLASPRPLAEPVTGGYVPLTPQRLLDTRPESQIGYVGEKPGTGAIVRVRVAGSPSPVPADASAVVLTVTGTEATANGYVTAWPCGVERPLTSNLNLVAGGTRPNTAIVGVGESGEVCIFTQSGTHLIVDVSGAFSASSTYAAVTPRRLLDTRPESQVGYAGDKPTEGQAVEIQVAGTAAGLSPPGTSAVVLNLTATETEGGGYVAVSACELPTDASALNVSPGATTANLVIAPVSTSGTVCLRTQRPMHLLVDAFGWFPTATSFSPGRPLRVLDTRTLGATPLTAGSTYRLPVSATWSLPSDTNAVVLDVVGVDAVNPGYVTVWPCGSPRPTSSNLNLDGPDPAAALVVTGMGPGDDVCIFVQSGAHLVVDLFGWFVLR